MHLRDHFVSSIVDLDSRKLYEPYTDNPETSGFMRIDAAVLNDVIPRFLRDGWQVVSAIKLCSNTTSKHVSIERSRYRGSCERHCFGRI